MGIWYRKEDWVGKRSNEEYKQVYVGEQLEEDEWVRDVLEGMESWPEKTEEPEEDEDMDEDKGKGKGKDKGKKKEKDD